MGHESAFKSLEFSLSQTIDKWLEEQAGADHWSTINCYVGRDLASQMATAAILLLRAAKQGQETMED